MFVQTGGGTFSGPPDICASKAYGVMSALDVYGYPPPA